MRARQAVINVLTYQGYDVAAWHVARYAGLQCGRDNGACLQGILSVRFIPGVIKQIFIRLRFRGLYSSGASNGIGHRRGNFKCDRAVHGFFLGFLCFGSCPLGRFLFGRNTWMTGSCYRRSRRGR